MNECHLKNKLLSAYEYFSSVGHTKNLARIRQLAGKSRSRTVGFYFR